jgi:hypothetical protein
MIGCESPSSLVELIIKMDYILKEELKQFEKAFERDQILDT